MAPKPRLIRLAAAIALLLTGGAARALKPGDRAPDFKGSDSNGRTESLAQYRGKWIVLEWANQGCPFEQKHYKSGNMERLQREWTAKGVVWLSVISSAPGEQGYVTAAQENDYLRSMHAAPTAAILDPAGTIGRFYEAKTTPHMFVVDPAGKLVYEGALDDRPSPDPVSLSGAHNFVSAALDEAMAGKPVSTAVTRPYGCSVKYAH